MCVCCIVRPSFSAGSGSSGSGVGASSHDIAMVVDGVMCDEREMQREIIWIG